MKMILTNKSLKRISALGVALSVLSAMVAIFAAFNPHIELAAVTAAIFAMLGSVLSIVTTEEIQRRSDIKIAQINVIAERANLKTEELRSSNLQLQLQVENERKKRLELEVKMGPRFLSPQQSFIITEELNKIDGNAFIHVYRRQDDETIQYSNQIIEAITKAQVHVTVHKGHIQQIGTPQYGVNITVGNGLGNEIAMAAFKNVVLMRQSTSHRTMI